MTKLRKLFGGISMSWPRVLVFSILSAVWSAVLLLLPIDLDIAGMGQTYPWWILFALVIITNCQKPLEAACKTFVFFLISQPLIYILQAPFSPLGLELLQYYPPWFLMTLLTFPGAWIGWHVRKPGLLSGVILSPMLFLITMIGYDYLALGIRAFPHNLLSLVSGLFCAAEFLLLVAVILHENKQRITAICATLLLIAGTFLFTLITKPALCSHWEPLPEGISAADVAEVEVADPAYFRASIANSPSAHNSHSYLEVDALKKDTSSEITLYDANGSVLCAYTVSYTEVKSTNPENLGGFDAILEMKLKED